jgi:hypothetical protein
VPRRQDLGDDRIERLDAGRPLRPALVAIELSKVGQRQVLLTARVATMSVTSAFGMFSPCGGV